MLIGHASPEAVGSHAQSRHGLAGQDTHRLRPTAAELCTAIQDKAIVDKPVSYRKVRLWTDVPAGGQDDR
jgi:hypothetical protein